MADAEAEAAPAPEPEAAPAADSAAEASAPPAAEAAEGEGAAAPEGDAAAAEPAAEGAADAPPADEPFEVLLTAGEDKAPPPGVYSLYCSGTTMEIVGAAGLDEDNPYKFVPKKTILDDIQFRGAISDFKDITDKIKEGPEEILIVYNENDVYGDGNNYAVFCTEDAVEAAKAAAKAAKAPAEGGGDAAADAAPAEPEKPKEPPLPPYAHLLPEDVEEDDFDAVEIALQAGTEVEVPPAYQLAEDGTTKIPMPGVESLFITGTTLEQVKCAEMSDAVPVKFVEKSVILADIQFRGNISDFKVIKDKIVKGPEQIMLRYNGDDIYGDGNNFDVLLSEEAIAEANAIEVVAARVRECEAALKAVKALPKKKRRKKKKKKKVVSKPWESFGSEVEIEEYTIVYSRELVKLECSKPRREFGRKAELGDKDSMELFNASHMEARPYKDPNYDLKPVLVDVDIQAVPSSSTTAMQATPLPACPGSSQYEDPSTFPTEVEKPKPKYVPRGRPEGIKPSLSRTASSASIAPGAEAAEGGEGVNPLEVMDAIQEGELPAEGGSDDAAYAMAEAPAAMDEELGEEHLASFLKGEVALSGLERALQQNETFDIFEDDLATLGEDDGGPGQRADADIVESHSFTDLSSKGQIVTCIQWWPGKRNVVAVSCAQPKSFDERVDVAGRVQNGCVSVWNFADPIHPQFVLEAPADVWHFSFNPTRPEIVAGGLLNGQVIIWDTTDVQEQMRRKKDKKKSDTTEEGGSGQEAPVVKHKHISLNDQGHTACVMDLHWFEPGLELSASKSKVQKAASANETWNFFSCATDGRVLVWDMRVQIDKKKGDELWAPILAVPLTRLDVPGDLACMRIDIGPFDKVGYRFFCGSQDGEVAKCSYERIEGEAHPEYTKEIALAHDGPIVSLQRSPFFPEICLSVGNFTFKLTADDVKPPVFTSPGCADTTYTAGCWSPTRPGLMFIGRGDGMLEVWDMMDRSHEPSLLAQASSETVLSMRFWSPSQGQTSTAPAPGLLAIGDTVGVLHIFELPRNLRRAVPGEKETMSLFFKREVTRYEYNTRLVVEREAQIAVLEEEEKAAAEAEAERAAKAAAAAAKAAADAEAEALMDPSAAEKPVVEKPTEADNEIAKHEKEYRVLEQQLLLELGLVGGEEEDHF